MAPLTCETLARCVTLISFVATCTVAVVYLTLHHASVDEVFDFVVVGGGSTGSVVAGRLGMAGYSVLLLEAGGATQRSLQPPGQGDSGSSSWWTVFDVPLGWLQVLSDHRWSKEFQWVVPADPPPAIARGLGGCGIHNAMLYMRGMPEDFEHWGDGWRWEDVLPFYLRSENNSVHAPATPPLRSSSQPHPHSTHCRQRLLTLEQVHRDSPHHGNSGPVQISSVDPDVISAAFVAASVAAGQPQNDDFNGASREGAGLYQFMIRDGSPRTSGSNRQAGRGAPAALRAHALGAPCVGPVRDSPAAAFLGLHVRPRSVRVRLHALVTRVLFDAGGGRATGVEYVRGRSPTHESPRLKARAISARAPADLRRELRSEPRLLSAALPSCRRRRCTRATASCCARAPSTRRRWAAANPRPTLPGHSPA